MNLRDQLSGIFWFAISIFVCIESIQSDVGTSQSPGPGFLPFWSGVILGTFAIFLILTSSLKKNIWKGKLKDLWKGMEWNKVIWVSSSLFLYSLFLPFMGYLITTFGLMTFLLGISGRSKMWIRGVSAFIIGLVSYLIFATLLDVRLPKGIFGF